MMSFAEALNTIRVHVDRDAWLSAVPEAAFRVYVVGLVGSWSNPQLTALGVEHALFGGQWIRPERDPHVTNVPDVGKSDVGLTS